MPHPSMNARKISFEESIANISQKEGVVRFKEGNDGSIISWMPPEFADLVREGNSEEIDKRDPRHVMLFFVCLMTLVQEDPNFMGQIITRAQAQYPRKTNLN